MTIEQLEQRHAVLTGEREQLGQQILAAQANLNAYNGAIMELERIIEWLKQEAQPEAQPQPNE